MHFEQVILIALAVASVSATKRALPWQKKFLELANKAREEEGSGLGRLCLNAKLNSAAHRYALTLQQTNQFSHEADGTKVGDRARQNGFQYEKVGENLASDDSAEGAFKRLMESEGHRKNILDPNFTMMGVGGTSLGEKHEGNWIQLFGKGANEKCIEEDGEDGNDKNEEGGGENDSFEEEEGDENGEFDPKELMSQFDGGLEMCVAPDQQGRPVKYECPFKEVRHDKKEDKPRPSSNNRPEDQKKDQNNQQRPSQNNNQQQNQPKQHDEKKKDQPQPAPNNNQQQNQPQHQGQHPRQAQQPRTEQYHQQTERKSDEKSTEQKSKETGQSGNHQYQRENQKKSSEKQESEKKQESKQQSCPGSSKQSHQQSERKSSEKKEEQKSSYQSGNIRKRSRIAGRCQRY